MNDLPVTHFDLTLYWELTPGGDTIRMSTVMGDNTMEQNADLSRMFRIREVADRGFRIEMPRPDVDDDLQAGADLHVQQAQLAAWVKHLDGMRR